MNNLIFKEFATPMIARPTDDSLVLWMNGRGSRRSGAVLEDLSKSKNNGVIHGASWGNTPLGHSVLSFDGSNDYVDCGNDESLTLGTGNFTISLWARQDTGTDYDALMAKGSYDGGGDFLIYDLNNASDRGYMSFRNDNNTGDKIINIGDNPLVGTGWRFITITRSGTTINTYLDGVFSHTGTIESNYDFINAFDWTIGARTTAGISHFFDGSIADVRIYNRALSAEEIMTSYDNSKYLYGF